MLTPIKRQVTDLVPLGLYAVHFSPIHGNRCLKGEHDDCLEHGCFDYGAEYVAEIESDVSLITEDNYRELLFDVTNKDESFNAATLWEGDTHDMRSRLFKSESEALEHIKLTVDRFNNPMPWEAFIKFT